jgi:hypothetical protein
VRIVKDANIGMSLVDPHLVHAVFVYSFLSNKQYKTTDQTKKRAADV